MPGPPTEPERRASLPFRVRFDEATPAGVIRTSVLLRYAADLAAFHSDQHGFGRAWYQERGLAWLVRGVDLEVLSRVAYGQQLVGTTEAVAARKVIARRRTEFRTDAGEPAAALTVDWALTTLDGTPTRIPPVFATVFTMPEGSFSPIRVREVPPDGATVGSARARGPDPRARPHGPRQQRRLRRLGGGGRGRGRRRRRPRDARRHSPSLAVRVPRRGGPAGSGSGDRLAVRERLVVSDRRCRKRPAVSGGQTGGLSAPARGRVPAAAPDGPVPAVIAPPQRTSLISHADGTTVLPSPGTCSDAPPRTAVGTVGHPEGRGPSRYGWSCGARRRLPRVRSIRAPSAGRV